MDPTQPAVPMPPRRSKGSFAEALVADTLARAGWQLLGRNVRLGRDEIDIVARDPGPPKRLVLIEVRERRSRDHGLAEESLDPAKRARLRRAAARLMAAPPDELRVPRETRLAVDLVVVERGRRGSGRPEIRHHRDVLATEV